jgi:hypothetical protein
MSDDALSRRLRQIREAEALPEPEPMPEAAPEEELEATAPRRRKPLGELLVGKGLISDEALEAALELQKVDGRPLGQILLAAGELTPQNLARTLTEQHGFDFSGTLRERLSTGDTGQSDTGQSNDGHAGPETPDMGLDDEPGHEPSGESYLLFEAGVPGPLHTAASFLDAADVAFELIDDRDPEQLQIVRFRDGQREQLWSYTRETAGVAPDSTSVS